MRWAQLTLTETDPLLPIRAARIGIIPEVQFEPGAITVRVPSVLEHEVVAVDFQ
jgi:hypothetical protein